MREIFTNTDFHFIDSNGLNYEFLDFIYFFQMLFKDLKMIKFGIKANFYSEISKITKKFNNSIKEINSFVKNIQKNLSFTEIDLFKIFDDLKTLEFFNFERKEFEDKYFCNILQEEVGTSTGTTKEESKDDKRPKKDIREDEFKKDKKKVKEIVKYVNGDVYEGDLEVGKKEGKGIYKFANGNVYEGEFKNDKIEGKGKFTDTYGDVYEGEFKDGKKEGKGIEKFANGNNYEGEFKMIKKKEK